MDTSDDATSHEKLADLEYRALYLYSHGETRHRIGEILHTGPDAASHYLNNAKEKLFAKTLGHAVRILVEMQLSKRDKADT